MGAWGIGAFENDCACDWSADLVEQRGLALVHDTLSSAQEVDDDELDLQLGREAVAACEVVARLQGRFGRTAPHTEAVDQWIRGQAIKPPPELIKLAARVLERVASHESELAQRWRGNQQWLASVRELRKRVGG